MAFSTLYAITKWRRNRRSVPSHESFDPDAVIARGDPRIEKTGVKTLLVKIQSRQPSVREHIQKPYAFTAPWQTQ
jgi:hypothetical protein